MDETRQESLKGATKTSKEPVSVEKLGLEEIVRLTNKIGLEYAEAKKKLDELDLMKPTIRAGISLRLEGAKITEAKLRRLTETDPEYVEYLGRLIEAKSQCDRMKIRYESYKNLFDARRSLLSYQKAELKLL